MYLAEWWKWMRNFTWNYLFYTFEFDCVSITRITVLTAPKKNCLSSINVNGFYWIGYYKTLISIFPCVYAQNGIPRVKLFFTHNWFRSLITVYCDIFESTINKHLNLMRYRSKASIHLYKSQTPNFTLWRFFIEEERNIQRSNTPLSLLFNNGSTTILKCNVRA